MTRKKNAARGSLKKNGDAGDARSTGDEKERPQLHQLGERGRNRRWCVFSSLRAEYLARAARGMTTKETTK